MSSTPPPPPDQPSNPHWPCSDAAGRRVSMGEFIVRNPNPRVVQPDGPGEGTGKEEEERKKKKEGQVKWVKGGDKTVEDDG